MKLIQYIPQVCFFVSAAMILCASKAAANPTTGAHTLAYYSCGGSGGLSTPAITTQATGSTILAWIGQGTLSIITPATAPTDNKGNTYALLGSTHYYNPIYTNSGEALYVSPSALGGSGHIFTAPMLAPDEITLAVVEVKNGGVIQDVQWNSVATPQTNQTSLSVTTTGPATLVAIWTGLSGDNLVTADPNNGFTVTDSELFAACQVQAAVATKDVAGAGTYNVTWTNTPAQGAHMWLVAVQSEPPALQAKVSGGNLTVSWPIVAGYSLETTSNLLNAEAWASVTNQQVIVGYQNMITNIVSQGSQFFRLVK